MKTGIRTAILAIALSSASIPAMADRIATVAGGGVGDGLPAIQAPVDAEAVAIDPAGHVHVADGLRVRRIDKSTGVITTVAGTGNPAHTKDGVAATAAGMGANAIAFDPAGNLYIADYFAHRVRRVDAKTGLVSTVIGDGTNASSGDGGPASGARVSFPRGIAVGPDGRLYVADGGGRRIRRIELPEGDVSTYAGTGDFGDTGDDGPAAAATLKLPSYLVIDAAGHLYFSDGIANRVRRIDAGTKTITAFAGTGGAPSGGDGGLAKDATFTYTGGLAVDAAGALLIADRGRIRRVESGTITTFAGTGSTAYAGDDGPAAAAGIGSPLGIATGSGQLYLTDATNYRVRRVNLESTRIDTLAGNGTVSFTGDGGPATQAGLTATDAESDPSGWLYIADAGNNRIRVVNPYTGTIGTVPLAGGLPLANPSSVTVNASRVTFTEAGYSKVRAFLTSAAQYGQVVEVAGEGNPGFSGDGGDPLLARLNFPTQVRDTAYGLFILDQGNRRVRRILDNVITTVAGNGGNVHAGDGGQATAASFQEPRGIAVSPQGHLFVADAFAGRVRRVDAVTGIISTVAGGGACCALGDGGPATSALLDGPHGLAFDGNGNLLIAETNGHRIRRVDLATGLITTVAGNGTAGTGPDGPDARQSLVNSITGMAYAPLNDDVHVTDSASDRVLALSPPRLAQSIVFVPPTVARYAPPGASEVTLAATSGSGLSVYFWSLTPSVCVARGTPGPSITLVSTGTCTIVASQPGSYQHDAAPRLTRSFPVTAGPVQSLAVTKAGSGAGLVFASLGRLSCGPYCDDTYYDGTLVTLSAIPQAGSRFAGWSGDCTGTAPCPLTMNAAKNVTATFQVIDPATSADLAVTLTRDTPFPATLQDMAFTIDTVNNGPATAANAVLVFRYPDAAGFVWAHPGCTDAPAPNLRRTVTCPLGTLAAGASARRKVVIRPTLGGAYPVDVTVSSDAPDIDPANSFAATVPPLNASQLGSPVLRYRLYSPVTLEHLYTTNLNEYNTLGALVGTWVQEGTVGKVLNHPGSYNGVDAVPYYRLYNTANQQHHWTSDPNEYYTLGLFPQYSLEGVDGWILPTQAPGTIPLYRLLYPFSVPVAGLHHWTIDRNEYDTLIASFGWVGEGGSGFVIP